MRRTATAVCLLLLAAPACIVFHDEAGVPIRTEALERIEVGRTSRQEVLALMGPPTGVFSTNLLATVTRLGQTIEQPATPGRIDDDVFTWQEIHITGRIAFFPVLFSWGSADIASRTLVIFFDDAGRVRDVAYREDRS